MQDQRWKRIGSQSSIDGLARNTIAMEVPEARHCREVRERSRKDMHELNEKLASQLERMRMVSEENRRLMEESDGSRGRYTKETEKLRKTYDTELRQLRNMVDDSEREKADSLAKMTGLQQTARALQDQINNLERTNRKLTNQLDEALKDGRVKDAENLTLNRHLASAQEENDSLRQSIDQLNRDNQQLHSNLDEETASRMACQAEMQTIREEMEFMRTVHEQEVEELRTLPDREHQEELDQWRDEMKRAIRDIQNEYDSRLDKIRVEMENTYTNRLAELSKNLSFQEMQLKKLAEENNVLRNQLDSARNRAEQHRAKCEDLERKLNITLEENQNLQRRLDDVIRDANRDRQAAEDALNRALQELSALMDAKLNLESEIAAYRRLLEAQDSLITNPKETRRQNNLSPPRASKSKELRVRVPSYVTSSEYSRNVRNDMSKRWMDRDEPSGQSARSNYVEHSEEIPSGSQQLSCTFSESRHPSGDKQYMDNSVPEGHSQVSITGCAKNGTYIELSNMGYEEESLAGWCLIRNIDHGRRIIRYTFPDRTLPPHTSIRIWSVGKMGFETGTNDFEAPYATWGTGNMIQTTLYSPDGVERAAHTQRVEGHV